MEDCFFLKQSIYSFTCHQYSLTPELSTRKVPYEIREYGNYSKVYCYEK